MYQTVMLVCITDLMRLVHDDQWVAAEKLVKGYLDEHGPRRLVIACLNKSPKKEQCAIVNFNVPDATVMHLLAHRKPRDFDSGIVWGAYYYLWKTVAAALDKNPAIDARAGYLGTSGPTALMKAAVQSNMTAVSALMQAGAGDLSRAPGSLSL